LNASRAKKIARTERTEAEVLAQVLEALRMFGIDADRQNTGAALNPKGQMVCFGRPGAADVSGQLPDGRKLDIEVKREGFDPNKLRGEKREHFERQLARLRRTNEQGGVGFWTDDAEELAKVILPLLLEGASVEEPGYGPLRIKRKDLPRC
jgi:hypothetical protein